MSDFKLGRFRRRTVLAEIGAGALFKLGKIISSNNGQLSIRKAVSSPFES